MNLLNLIKKYNFSLKIKMAMVFFFLIILGSLVLGQPKRILFSIIIVFVSASIDLAFNFKKNKKLFIPESAILTGLIISLISDTLSHPFLSIVAGAVAIFGKKYLKFGRPRHLMNPAAFALVAVSLFAPIVSWWALSWGLLVTLIICAFGFFIVYKINKIRLVGSFLIVYAILLFIVYIKNGFSFLDASSFLFTSVFDGAPIFFMTIMLIEPVTSSFARKNFDIYLGLLVGFLSVIIPTVFKFLNFTDPLLLALIIGNIILGLKTIPKTSSNNPSNI